MTTCIYTIGSVTQANRAKRILAENSISVKIIKITDQSKKGCIHGIEFNCANKLNINRILLRASINFEEYQT
ncbi:MAG: DUF3343 domain-containing protein [Clostridia bacterium]|nr:DUF3343 domain-containing protein [Clostridia bacterium]